MATLRVYENGLSMGHGNPAPTGGKRGKIKGWTPATLSRMRAWFFSVDTSRLDGDGYGLTLTLRETPTQSDWAKHLHRLQTYLTRQSDILRWAYVVEWQRRGTPHLHVSLHVGDYSTVQSVIDYWMTTTHKHLRQTLSPKGQYATPLYESTGWLKYLSKHATKSANNYQRHGAPPGWEGTGKLWAHSRGDTWPSVDPLIAQLDRAAYITLRRWIRRYQAAEARKRNDKRWKWYRNGKRYGSDPTLSAVHGISSWVPIEDTLRMIGGIK